MVIWRYNTDGSPDTAFDTDGIVVNVNPAGGNGDDGARFLVEDPDEKILVAGYSINSSGDYDMIICRYNNNGSLDDVFNYDGMDQYNNAAGGDGTDVARAVTLDSDNKILIVGFSTNASANSDLAIWRYLP